jgi:hypothetical protein
MDLVFLDIVMPIARGDDVELAPALALRLLVAQKTSAREVLRVTRAS